MTPEADRELLGDQLHLHREDALPQLALAGVGRDAAVGADGEPRIELPGDALILRRERPLREGELVGAGGEAAEAHDQRAAALQEIASRGAHAFAPALAAAPLRLGRREYRLIARRMRVCVKQRQSTVDIACWICASLGCGF